MSVEFACPKCGITTRCPNVAEVIGCHFCDDVPSWGCWVPAPPKTDEQLLAEQAEDRAMERERLAAISDALLEIGLSR